MRSLLPTLHVNINGDDDDDDDDEIIQNCLFLNNFENLI